MNERNTPCPSQCPRTCPCQYFLNIVNSIADEESAIACILGAECAKINKVVSAYDDYEALVAIDTSVQTTLDKVIILEGILKEKLDAILPLISECR